MDIPFEYKTYQIAGHKAFHVKMSDSTNTLLDSCVRNGQVSPGSILVSETQKQGRGMMNTVWESAPEKNLLFSLYHRFTGFGIADQFFLSKVIALAVTQGINHFLNANEIKIKWPNDLYWGSEKIGGILIQNNVRDQDIQYSILGIGINANQTAFPNLPHASSLHKKLGREVDRSNLLKSILKAWDDLSMLLNPLEKAQIDTRYYKHLWGFQEYLPYRHNELDFQGKILAVQADGRVVLELSNGTRKVFEIKEVALNLK